MVSGLIQHPGPGCVVEFMQGNQPVTGIVIEEKSGRLRVFTQTGRETAVPAARLLPWSGPAHEGLSGRNAMEETLKRHVDERTRLARSIDTQELWELAQGEVASAPAGWFAELLGQEPSVDMVAAVGRALIEQKTHFKFQPPLFHVLSAEDVARRLDEAERQRMVERIATAGRDFVKTLFNLPPGQTPPVLEDEGLAQRLREVILARIGNPEDPDSEAVWRELRKGLPEISHLPLLLATRWGIVPPHYNFHFDQADYDPGDDWAAPFAEDVRRLAGVVAGLPEPAPGDTAFVSIDSASTRDIDDAFLIRRAPGGIALSVALACPALGWEFGGDLDKAVRDRATSIYLPEGASNMLPTALATDVFSLRAGRTRPALVAEFLLSEHGAVLSKEFRFAPVRVAENATYEAAEQAIEDEPEGRMALAHSLALALRERRIERGAVIIERPDPSITLTGYPEKTEVHVEEGRGAPKAQLLVSEFMILANEACALWAQEKGIALLHRTQDVALPRELAGVWEDPVDIFRAVKQMGPALLEVEAKPHRALGLAAYAPVTSPLRRYPDLVNAAQVLSFLTTGTPRFDAEELSAKLPRLSARLDAAAQVQRYRPRYWKLTHIKQHPKRLWPAVALEDCGQLVNFALPDLQIFVRAPKNLCGDKFLAGQRFSLIFGKVDPLGNEIRVSEALAE